MSRVLDIYLHEKFVGKLTQNDSGDLEFAYDQSYLESEEPGISLSLPKDQRFSSDFPNNFFKGTYYGKEVKAFFSGLLPDESMRERLASNLGVSETNSFALLTEIGGECAGALALYPHGQKPSSETREIEILDDDKLRKILDLIRDRPMLAGDDGYRMSLAGAQDKLAVGFEEGKVQLIKGGAPTTHILKPIIENEQVQYSAHNELFCMKLAKRMGIDVPEAILRYVHDTPYFLVKRYDREICEDGNVKRIHQEDFCQALGIAPEIKYEKEGGPNIKDCLNLITNHTARPAVDRIKFLDIVIFNFLIGNADAHGKNFSLLYLHDKPELAPAYDLLSTAVYPKLSKNMAMQIDEEYKPGYVYLHNFYKLVADTKAAKKALNRKVQMMSGIIVNEAVSLKTKLQKEGLASDIFEKIIKIIKKRSARLTE